MHPLMQPQFRYCRVAVVSFVLFVLFSVVIHSIYPSAPLLLPAQPVMATYYVAPDGNDTNSGSKAQPFATIAKAREVVRATLTSGAGISGTRKMTGNILVYLRGGRYFLDQTLSFDERDSGNSGFSVIYKAYPNEHPVLSGGRLIKGWQPVAGTPLWKAIVPGGNFHQLYVNNQRRQRARSEQLRGQAWYATDDRPQAGFVVEGDRLPNRFANPSQMQVRFQLEWRDYTLPVEKIVAQGNRKAIAIAAPYFEEAQNSRLPEIKFNTPFYLENDLSFLKTPGEWVFQPNTQELFYWPLASEPMNRTEVMAPSLLQLLKIEGSALNRKVHHLRFEGLTLAHAGRWTPPDAEGWFVTQAQQLIRPKIAGGMTPAVISLNAAEDIVFDRNLIEHHGIVGISLTNGVNQVTIRGNVLHDIGDSAITVGSIAHLQIKPGQEVTKDNLIQDNLIFKSGQDFWGAPGIQAYWTTRLTIDHNEISDLPYTGVAVGWGWKAIPNPPTCLGNRITNNHIARVMQRLNDGGGIYILGTQPGSLLSGNYIEQVKHDFGGIYFDQGSAYYTATHNVLKTVPRWLNLSTDFIHDLTIDRTWTSTAAMIRRGSNISLQNTTVVPDAHWPPAAEAIVNNAGLEPNYRNLLDLRTAKLTESN